MPNADGLNPPSGRFATTRWSIVQAAGGGSSSQAHDALESLCRTYWYPLYAYVRRRGFQACDAQDLTQGFITSLLDRSTVARADPERGRFRSFLLGSLNHFLSDERKKVAAKKRGGDQTVFSIDVDSAEQRYQHEPANDVTAEDIFERRWAMTVLDASLARVESEYADSGKQSLFDSLRGHLGGDADSLPNREIGERLGMQEGAVKVAVHRLRRRYREALRSEISQTVDNQTDLDDELSRLLSILSAD